MRNRRLLLLRHGQTEYNATSRMQGQLDTDLSDLGRAQAVAAATVRSRTSLVSLLMSRRKTPAVVVAVALTSKQCWR